MIFFMMTFQRMKDKKRFKYLKKNKGSLTFNIIQYFREIDHKNRKQ